MRSLWFKNCFVAPILSGEKSNTIRRPSSRLPAVGETVALTVGPRPPFAYASIVAVEPVDEMPDNRTAQIRDCLGESAGPLVRLSFVLADELMSGGQSARRTDLRYLR